MVQSFAPERGRMTLVPFMDHILPAVQGGMAADIFSGKRYPNLKWIRPIDAGVTRLEEKDTPATPLRVFTTAMRTTPREWVEAVTGLTFTTCEAEIFAQLKARNYLCTLGQAAALADYVLTRSMEAFKNGERLPLHFDRGNFFFIESAGRLILLNMQYCSQNDWSPVPRSMDTHFPPGQHVIIPNYKVQMAPKGNGV
ncbi:MAG: hypothetical protein WAN50_03170 [Minisyncoccia bacterium]